MVQVAKVWFDKLAAMPICQHARSGRIKVRLMGDAANGCIEWIGRRGRRPVVAPYRRVVEAVLGRPIGPAHLMHSCDNPRCVNPDHLREGSHAENMADMSAKKRCAGQINAPSARFRVRPHDRVTAA